jgi:hypothetical protein
MKSRSRKELPARWTPKEDAILLAHYVALGPKQTAAKLQGRSQRAVCKRAHNLRHGLTGNGLPPVRWTEAEDAVLHKHYRPLGAAGILSKGLLKGHSYDSIRSRARKLGLKYNRRRKWTADWTLKEDAILCTHWPVVGTEGVVGILQSRTHDEVEARAMQLELVQRNRGRDMPVCDAPTLEEIAEMTKEFRDMAQAERETQEILFDGCDGPSPEAVIDRQFELWWQRYPRKEAIGRARKAFAKALKAASYDELCAGVDNYCAVIRSRGTERKFVALPATWLNDKRWRDELPKSVVQSRADKKHADALAAEKAAASQYCSGLSRDEFDRRVDALRTYDHRIAGTVPGPEGKPVLAKYAVAVWRASKKETIK